MDFSSDVRQAESVEFEEKSSSSQILLKSVEVDNLDKWSDNLCYNDYVQDDRTKTRGTAVWAQQDQKTTVIKNNVKVKFHQDKLFMETFDNYLKDNF